MILFFSADKKELKSGSLSADKSADHRPTVGVVNVITVLFIITVLNSFSFYMRKNDRMTVEMFS